LLTLAFCTLHLRLLTIDLPHSITHSLSDQYHFSQEVGGLTSVAAIVCYARIVVDAVGRVLDILDLILPVATFHKIFSPILP
jgi:hypothetical protein